MELLFVMGNIDITAKYTFKNGVNKTITIAVPSCNIFAQCAVKYKPIIIYGTKGKRFRKTSK